MMFNLIVVFAILTLLVLAFGRANGHGSIVETLSVCSRLVRLQTGRYTLADLMHEVVAASLGCALPGVGSQYLANDFRIGVHPYDYKRFEGVLVRAGDELAGLIEAEADRQHMTALGSVRVRIDPSHLARPGRPIIHARVARTIDRAKSDGTLTMPMPGGLAATDN